VSWLDADKDNYWSLEDVEGAPNYKETILPAGKDTGNMTKIFNHLLADVESFNAVVDAKLSSGDVDVQTSGRTRIPMEWMRKEQGVFKMCNNVDPRVCGNLEARGILAPLKLRGNPQDSDKRIQACRDTFKWCDKNFNEVWHWYALQQQQRCGAMTTKWYTRPGESIHHGLNVNLYARQGRYNPMNANAVTRRSYLAFLFLILIIWWLSIFSELRQIIRFCVTLALIPGGDTAVRHDPDNHIKITIDSIHVIKKVLCFVISLIPRTIIAIALAYIGTNFLLGANNYSDLILNSLALSFISEVDEMLFMALMSTYAKDVLQNAQPLAVQLPCRTCHALNHPSVHTTIPLLMFLLMIVSTLVVWDIANGEGMFSLSIAYDCLCDLEGPTCMAAQIFGGETFLNLANIS
jgi:hypothetical protein